MSRRTKIIIALIILALIALVLWLALRPRPTAPAPSNQAANVNVNAPKQLPASGSILNVNSEQPVVNQVPPPPPDPLLALKQLARTFAERYGSFSNQGFFENQTDLEPFMSASYAAVTEERISKELAKPRPDEYHGFTTRALNVTVDSVDESAGQAVLTVKTQRQEFSTPTGDGVVTYQDITLGFVKEEGEWRLDSAKWQ